jgi:hypothetical protein
MIGGGRSSVKALAVVGSEMFAGTVFLRAVPT